MDWVMWDLETMIRILDFILSIKGNHMKVIQSDPLFEHSLRTLRGE